MAGSSGGIRDFPSESVVERSQRLAFCAAHACDSRGRAGCSLWPACVSWPASHVVESPDFAHLDSRASRVLRLASAAPLSLSGLVLRRFLFCILRAAREKLLSGSDLSHPAVCGRADD